MVSIWFAPQPQSWSKCRGQSRSLATTVSHLGQEERSGIRREGFVHRYRVFTGVCDNSAVAKDTSGMSKEVFTDIDYRISVSLGVQRVCGNSAVARITGTAMCDTMIQCTAGAAGSGLGLLGSANTRCKRAHAHTHTRVTFLVICP